jgi:hypothetical protein
MARKRRGGNKSRVRESEEDDLKATMARQAVLARCVVTRIKTSMISFVLVWLHFTNLSSSH